MESSDKNNPIVSPLQLTDLPVSNKTLVPVPESLIRVVTERAKADSVIIITVALKPGNVDVEIATADCGDSLILDVLAHVYKAIKSKEI